MVTLLQLKETLKNYDTLASELDLFALDSTYSLESDACEVDIDSFESDAQDYINESVQVIYYGKAIDFLAENDATLNDSIEIALEFGYELKDINSELLASLLLQDICRNELSNLINDLQE